MLVQRGGGNLNYKDSLIQVFECLPENIEQTQLNKDIDIKSVNYNLNRNKSISKKMQSANYKEPFTIEFNPNTKPPTYKIICQAGLYEFIRRAVHAYFTLTHNHRYECQITLLQEKSASMTVQSNYKILKRGGGNAFYSLSLYHTTSTLQINGKGASDFLKDDWPKMMQLIEQYERTANKSHTYLNEAIRKQISSLTDEIREGKAHTLQKQEDLNTPALVHQDALDNWPSEIPEGHSREEFQKEISNSEICSHKVAHMSPEKLAIANVNTALPGSPSNPGELNETDRTNEPGEQTGNVYSPHNEHLFSPHRVEANSQPNMNQAATPAHPGSPRSPGELGRQVGLRPPSALHGRREDDVSMVLYRTPTHRSQSAHPGSPSSLGEPLTPTGMGYRGKNLMTDECKLNNPAHRQGQPPNKRIEEMSLMHPGRPSSPGGSGHRTGRDTPVGVFHNRSEGNDQEDSRLKMQERCYGEGAVAIRDQNSALPRMGAGRGTYRHPNSRKQSTKSDRNVGQQLQEGYQNPNERDRMQEAQREPDIATLPQTCTNCSSTRTEWRMALADIQAREKKASQQDRSLKAREKEWEKILAQAETQKAVITGLEARVKELTATNRLLQQIIDAGEQNPNATQTPPANRQGLPTTEQQGPYSWEGHRELSQAREEIGQLKNEIRLRDLEARITDKINNLEAKIPQLQPHHHQQVIQPPHFPHVLPYVHWHPHVPPMHSFTRPDFHRHGSRNEPPNQGPPHNTNHSGGARQKTHAYNHKQTTKDNWKGTSNGRNLDGNSPDVQKSAPRKDWRDTQQRAHAGLDPRQHKPTEPQENPNHRMDRRTGDRGKRETSSPKGSRTRSMLESLECPTEYSVGNWEQKETRPSRTEAYEYEAILDLSSINRQNSE